MRRVLRVVFATLVALFLLLTLAAFAVDLSPLGSPRPARSLYAGPYVRVGATLVAYRRWGSRGTPIVLLGGAGEPTWVWHSVAPRLAAAGHRVFVNDPVDSVASGRATAAALGVPLELVSGAGHLSMLSQPTRVAALILRAAARPAARRVPRLRHVVLVVFENREANQVAGSPEAPHFNAYAHQYAELTDYTAVAHPSLPNYLALVSGSTHGITSDCTSCSVSGPSLGSLLSSAGRSWEGYAQGFPASPLFAKKHMPFLYFPAETSHVHPLAALMATKLPAFALVAPDLCQDAHDCPLAAADRFLGHFLPPLLHVPGTAVFIVFDEGTTNQGGGGHIFAFAAGTAVRHHTDDTVPTDHYGLLRTIEDALDVRPLGLSAARSPISGIWR
jgi:phosphatidylinositol-3-phosphatase